MDNFLSLPEACEYEQWKTGMGSQKKEIAEGMLRSNMKTTVEDVLTPDEINEVAEIAWRKLETMSMNESPEDESGESVAGDHNTLQELHNLITKKERKIYQMRRFFLIRFLCKDKVTKLQKEANLLRQLQAELSAR